MSVRIKPTVGRVVWYWLGGTTKQAQPFAAIIAFVLSDSRVNLSVIDPDGGQHGEQDVPLIQEEEEKPGYGINYCEWMPYQKQVAAGQIEPTLHKT